MHLSDLPLELVTIIVDYFRDEKDALELASLASRLFLTACRAILFKTLRLRILDPFLGDKCNTLLGETANIVNFIQVLELQVNPNIHTNRREDVERTGLPSLQEKKVLEIIRKAVNIHSLILRFESQSWKKLSHTFQQVIFGLLRRDLVSSLNIEDVSDFPIQELSWCKGLRDLSLACVHVDPMHTSGDSLYVVEHPRGIASTKEYLSTITLFMSDSCVEPLIQALGHPSSQLSFSRIERLSVNLTGSDGRSALARLPFMSPSITTLELRTDGVNGYDLCNLDDFPELRTLLVDFSYNRHQQPLAALGQFISKSGTPSKLEELQLVFRHDVPELHHEKGSQDMIRLCVNNDWRILEKGVIDRGLFNLLRKMTVAFRPKDLTRFIHDRLPALQFLLRTGMPMLFAITNPKIEVFNDRFEQYATQTSSHMGSGMIFEMAPT